MLVLPEDDANRQIVNGFIKDHRVNGRCVQVMPVAGGWMKVIERLANCALEKFPYRRVLMLIDFDDEVENRTTMIRSEIERLEQHLSISISDRVYFLGVSTEPETFRTMCKKRFEEIGETLAEECAENKSTLWTHEQLDHNAVELARLVKDVKPFLFMS